MCTTITNPRLLLLWIIACKLRDTFKDEDVAYLMQLALDAAGCDPALQEYRA